MSVINQMLKDLEQRSPEQGQAPSTVPIKPRTSIINVVIITVLVLLSVNVLGFYIWNLQTQVADSDLKLKQSLAQEARIKKERAQETMPAVDQRQSVEPAKTTESTRVTSSTLTASQQAPLPTVINIPSPSAEKTENKVIASPTSTKVLKPQNQIPVQQVTAKLTEKNIPPKASQMSVSRRQLTTEELVNQKLLRAEKAINTNQITQAENLFEEVLILQASNKQARKKLAALWFGRQSYQQAINLLSQGIALDKQDAELRMLKAQIYLKQGQHEGAYHTLKALPDLQQQDYQVMLANVAQQIEAYPSAITAYQVLIKMQPYSGKWHLGLAIVYDRNGQFSLAEKAYAQALSKNDLSQASAEFAQQRMQVLGE